MNLKKLVSFGAAASLTPFVALAQEVAVEEEAVEAVLDAADAYAAVTALSVEMTFIFNTLLFIIGGFLVFFMAAGFCMLEAGLVRSKNTTMQLMKNISLFSLASIAYFAIGFMLMYPGDAWIIDGWLGLPLMTFLEPVGVTIEEVDDPEYASVASDFFFQLMFCAATASIVSGAVAERIKLWPFLIFVIVLTGLIYPIQASWSWGEGWLYEFGFSDFAGSSIVHSAGGWAALTGIIILGARAGKYGPGGKVNPIPGSNLALSTLGVFILWLGWFGFNGGSELAMGGVDAVSNVSRIMANTNAAAAAGGVAALILSQVMFKKPDLTLVLNGVLGGLVAITAEPLEPSLLLSTIIGAVGGIIVVLTVPLMDKLKWDDVVGAVPVHLFAGIWGTIAVVFSNTEATLVAQLVGIVAIGIFMAGASAITWLILNAAMGLRVDAESETSGLDKVELGMEAYPEFSKG